MQGLVKDFSKITKDPHRLAEECYIVIQIYQSGFSDLYQLAHMLVSEGKPSTG